MPKQVKVPISERALKQRINRALAADGQALRAARGAASAELGEYFIFDIHRDTVKSTHQDLEVLGKKLGVLKAYESLTSKG